IVQANSDKDGNLMVQLGYAQVSAGQADAGLKLIEQGIAKDKLKRPEDAKLHLGIAQLLAGKKAKAQQTSRQVGGTAGTADPHRRLLAPGGNRTGLTDKLVDDGFVERRDDPTDRRAYTVLLTPAGKKLFRQMAKAHEGWVVQLFERLPPPKKTQLFALLGELKQSLGVK